MIAENSGGSVLVTEKDVPADFIARSLAVEWANKKFLEWCEANNVCTHPASEIRARILNWEPEKCQFFCKCGLRMEVNSWLPATIQKLELSSTSGTAIR